MMIRHLAILFACTGLLAAPAQAQEPKYDQHNRYTVKFFCGDAKGEFHLLHGGNYRTIVSVYNADFNTAQFTVQAATISQLDAKAAPENLTVLATADFPKEKSEVAAHGVRLIGCDEIERKYFKPGSSQPTTSAAGSQDASNPEKKDAEKPYRTGLLIITSTSFLDVTALYSVAATASAPASSFSMGEVIRRNGRSCVRDETIKLSDFRNWEIESRARPISLFLRQARTHNELDPNRKWMEYGSVPVSGAEYFYYLRYCVCSEGGKLKGDVKSVGSSTGTLHAAAATMTANDGKVADLWDMQGQANPGKNATTVDMETNKSKEIRISHIGNGYIKVKVSRGVGSSAISFDGTLSLEDGHFGKCTQ